MQILPVISFHQMPSSDAIEMDVRKRIERLERTFSRITSCRVTIERSTLRHRRGNLFTCRVDLTLPGGEIVVRREPPGHQAYQDVYVAIRDAFDAARRQLEDFVNSRYRNRKRSISQEDRQPGMVK